MTSEWQRYCAVLRAARERLENLRHDDPAIPAFLGGLTRIESMLRRPLRIVILGEYNSGKSSLTDLILGKGLLPVSVVANTGVPVLVRHGESPALFGMNGDGIQIRIDGDENDALTDLDYRAVEIRLPLPWLRNHNLLDTPATVPPAVFAADADIVIWCTVATRAWTESERNLWSTLPPRVCRNAVLIATHKDSFYSDEDCAQVLRRLKSITSGLFRDVLLVSAADPEQSDAADSGLNADAAEDAAPVRAAIEASATAVRERRATKAKQITRRLARLAVHEFGRSAIRPEAAGAMSIWHARADRVVTEHTEGRLPLDRTLEALLQAFAQTADALHPGIIRGAGQMKQPVGIAAPRQRPGNVKSDLTAVLHILAAPSRYESPDSREQREGARATLLSLADLDRNFSELGSWLASHRPGADTPRLQARA